MTSLKIYLLLLFDNIKIVKSLMDNVFDYLIYDINYLWASTLKKSFGWSYYNVI